MRVLLLAVLTFGASITCAADLAVWQSAVRLDTAEDLARLRATNPNHYARAKRLLAAANTLCQPGRPKAQNADARDISCELLLLTSNPPKRRFSFTLDKTRYDALVTMTADQPKPLPLGRDRTGR